MDGNRVGNCPDLGLCGGILSARAYDSGDRGRPLLLPVRHGHLSRRTFLHRMWVHGLKLSFRMTYREIFGNLSGEARA
jgi:hypothetical protein